MSNEIVKRVALDRKDIHVKIDDNNGFTLHREKEITGGCQWIMTDIKGDFKVTKVLAGAFEMPWFKDDPHSFECDYNDLNRSSYEFYFQVNQ